MVDLGGFYEVGDSTCDEHDLPEVEDGGPFEGEYESLEARFGMTGRQLQNRARSMYIRKD